MTTAPAIQIKHLTKFFGTRCVVNDLSLEVRRGTIFGFLGRNGAGKSTTIRTLLGLQSPTRGSTQVLGCDSQKLTPEIRERVGYLAEGHHVYGWMRVAEAEKFQSSFYRHWNREVFWGVAKHFNLGEKSRAGNLSRGERAGLCLALALAPEPELLILDDPALGLDPVARNSLLQLMLYVTRSEGRTILFSSHILSDVERVADQIAVIDHGTLRACCSVDTFSKSITMVTLHYKNQPPPEKYDIPGLLQCFRTETTLVFTIVHFNPETAKALDGLKPDAVETTDLGLESSFVGYVGDRGEKSFLFRNNQPVE